MVVSPHRCNRPWTGEVSKPQKLNVPEYDPKNALCPGNTRANGVTNPNYSNTFIFDNDFPALNPIDFPDSSVENDKSLAKEANQADLAQTWSNEGQVQDSENSIFYRSKPATGKCRVMCLHPKTNMSIPLLDIPDINAVIDTWAEEVDQLQKTYCYVQVFENKGNLMGCSNIHPHCQIWASNFYPNVIAKKIKAFTKYFEENSGKSMILEYARSEMEIIPETGQARGADRIIYQNDSFLVLVPFWAMWPFETLLIFYGRENVGTFSELTKSEREDLSKAMQHICIKYDNLFTCSFAYSMGFQVRPNVGDEIKNKLGWQFHAHYFPPLLRSATVKKHIAGYELLAQPQRDLTPEMAAKKLNAVCGKVHYTKNIE